MVRPYWVLSTYRRPTSMACSTAARRAGSASPASRAWIPALIFSQTRGTPKNAVGWTSPTALISCCASGQKCTCPAVLTGR